MSKKASDFKVGMRVVDLDEGGTVSFVGDITVRVDFDRSSPFTFEEGIDLQFLSIEGEEE